MIDHVNLPVRDLERARTFYSRVLKPLGLVPLMADGQAVGFGRTTWTFGIVLETRAFTPLHLAFAASRDQVDAFHAAALAAGGTSLGAPGLRPHYDPDYDAAYVRDPDGHRIEAVCRAGA